MAKGLAGGNGNGGSRKPETQAERAAEKPAPAAMQKSVSGGGENGNSDQNPGIHAGRPPGVNAGAPKRRDAETGNERTVTIDVPLQVYAGLNPTDRIDVHLNWRQTMVYRHIYDAIILKRERLADGTYIGKYQADTIRWLLEKIADAAGL